VTTTPAWAAACQFEIKKSKWKVSDSSCASVFYFYCLLQTNPSTVLLLALAAIFDCHFIFQVKGNRNPEYPNFPTLVSGIQVLFVLILFSP
jgi:hypothetical protein